MKNLMSFAIAALCLFAGCTKDNPQTEPTKQELTYEQTLERCKVHADEVRSKLRAKVGDPSMDFLTTTDRGACNRVPICHNGNSIVVNKSAVQAHMAHGDQLSCCENSCLNNSQELLKGGPYNWYYDTGINDCFGLIPYDGYDEAVFLESDALWIEAEAVTVNETTYYFVYVVEGESYACAYYYTATQEEYECVRDYVRSVVTANSCIPNLCDL